MTFTDDNVVKLSIGLENRKPPIWLVEGLLEEGTLSSLVAPSGSYKSFMAIDIALSIAHGIQWQGKNVRKGSVVYCVGEGLSGVYSRSLAWHNHQGLSPDDADLYLLTVAQSLKDPEASQALFDVIDKTTSNHKPKLIIIDTLSRYSTGMDENSNSDMALLIETITNKLAIPLGCAVMLIHHTGKQGSSARGASALTGTLDTEWFLTATKTGDLLKATLSNTKTKDHEPPEDMEFEMVRVPIVEGEEAKSLVPQLLLSSAAEVAHTLQEKLRGEGIGVNPTIAQQLYAYLADAHENGEDIATLKAKDIGEALGTDNISRAWQNMRDSLQSLAREHDFTATTLAKLMPKLATYLTLQSSPTTKIKINNS
mgnify:FL=1